MPPTSPRKLAAIPGASALALRGAVVTRAGACPQGASAPGSVALALPTFGYAVCAATRDT